MAAQRQRQQQAFDIAPAAALAAHGHGGFAARQQHAGRAEWLFALGGLQRDAGQHLADVARLALQRVAEDVGVVAGWRATAAAASSAICGVAAMRISARARRGSPGLTDSARPERSASSAASGRAMP